MEKDQFIVLGLMAALGLAFGLGVWKPARSEAARLEHDIAQRERELSELSNATEGLPQWKERVDLLHEKLQGAQQYVPRHNEQGQVIRGLTTSLGEFGVNQQEMVIRSTVHGPEYSVIPIVLEFESSFPSVYNSLKRIEQMPRLVRVERLSVRSDPRRPAKPTQVHLELGTFYSQANDTARTNPKGADQ